MMLQRSCQYLVSRLLQVPLVPGSASVVAYASRPGVRKPQRRRQQSQLIYEVRKEEQDQPGYLEELEDARQLMTFAESSSAVGSSMRARIRAEHRSAVRRRVAAAKAAKLRPPELNLLTWAAKRQLVELAAGEPALWTPRALSEVFPVSVRQAEGLVRRASSGAGLALRDPAAIYRHDKEVLERLRQLRDARRDGEGRPMLEDVKPGFEWLVRSDKWRLLAHAAGNPVLPLPQQQLIEDALEAAARRPVGPFEALVRAQEEARPRRSRLQAFIELCERQKQQVATAARAFTVEETKEKYLEAGLLPKHSEEVGRLCREPRQHLTMFAAAAAAPEPPPPAKEEEEEVSEKKETAPKSFGELVEQLEADSLGLPKSNSKMDKVRPPLRYRARVNMDRLRIFRYSFGPKEKDIE